jgi:diguanylate cyclase (GGDEF)-like protein
MKFSEVKSGIGRSVSGLSRWWIFFIGIVLVAVLGYLDYISGAEISFSLFYVAPIALVAWFAGPHEAVAVSAFSAATWYAADLWAGSTYSYGLIPIWNAVMRLGFFIIVVWALTMLKREMDAREELSREDPLTGACNTRCFYQEAEHELKRSRRYGSPLSFAYIDLDNFKTINDTLGHSTGDDLLRLVAETISGNVRGIDVTARMGGDEFALLMPETDFFGSGVALEKLKELLDHRIYEKKWPVTFSIGLVTYERPPDSIEEMIREADTLMYMVKGSSKNAIRHEVRGIAED